MTRKSQYKKGSGLHEHHIIPKHMGGTDEDGNLTYLTVREHIIAHYLLYRINHDPNDLRSMHMLGANLTALQRQITGEYCRDNNIGIFRDDLQHKRTEWSSLGFEASKKKFEETGVKNFFYWSTEVGRKERARLGGIASYKSGNNPKFVEQQGTFSDRSLASAAAAKSAKNPVTNGTITKKLRTDHDVEIFLTNNPDWRKGTHHPSKRKGLKTGVISHRARQVTDGYRNYASLLIAANEHNVSQATIMNWCKSTKKPNWSYVEDVP
jgi:hypothetical protein